MARKSYKEFYALLEEAGHTLIRKSNGEIDIWQMDADFHNGPRCSKCRESWCQHCQNDIDPCEVK